MEVGPSRFSPFLTLFTLVRILTPETSGSADTLSAILKAFEGIAMHDDEAFDTLVEQMKHVKGWLAS